jgi:hypothetical protein
MSNIPREWWGAPEDDEAGLLPPDPLPTLREPYCEHSGDGEFGWYTCTRLPGHTGRHAASDGELIVAVWE